VICPPCNEQKHVECTNPETCPCQHRKTVHMADGTVSPQSERNALRMVEEEPFKVQLEELPKGATIASPTRIANVLRNKQ